MSNYQIMPALTEEGGLEGVTDTGRNIVSMPTPVTCHTCGVPIQGPVIWDRCGCGQETRRTLVLADVRDGHWVYGPGHCYMTPQPFCTSCRGTFVQDARRFGHPTLRAGICALCGRPFMAIGIRRRDYCSDECVAAARNTRRRGLAMTERCAQCAAALPPARADARFCSNACRQRAYRRRRNRF
jgi:predicted nucleic acid-binding Zn ribbon protein